MVSGWGRGAEWRSVLADPLITPEGVKLSLKDDNLETSVTKQGKDRNEYLKTKYKDTNTNEMLVSLRQKMSKFRYPIDKDRKCQQNCSTLSNH